MIIRHITFCCILLLSITSVLFAQPQNFIKETELGETTDQINFKIKKPKPNKGTVLSKGIQIKGCWLNDGFSSIEAKDKNKKKVKFKLNADSSALEFKKVKTIKFPISVSLKFTEARTVVPKASAVIAKGTTKCETVKKKDGSTKQDCSATIPVARQIAFSGIQCSTPSDFTEQVSEGQVVFADGDEFTIRKQTDPLRFAMINQSFSADLSDYTVIVNDQSYMAPDLQLVNGILTLNAPLVDGLNTATVSAIDADGFQAVNTFNFWAGSNDLVINFIDISNQPVTSGQVTVAIGDNSSVKVGQNFNSGTSTFTNLPGVTLSISAQGDDGSAGFIAIAGDSGTANITMLKFNDESTVNNNDFSQGTEGWEIEEEQTVSVIPHSEDEPPTLPATLGNRDNTVDNDIVLHTSGEGTRFMTRTFRTDPKTKLVRIRYRFQTSEYPGGYYGSKYNDFYNVALRSSKGSSILDDGSSMNALGEGAFSPSGYTAWKSTVIPVNRSNDKVAEVVQATIAVANVADGAFDSRVIVDKIEESPFAITQAEVLDIDNSPISNISLDKHTYFDGFTRINGTITLEGESDDQINYIYLQLMRDGQEVAAAELSTQAMSKLYNKKFGKAKKLQIKNPMLLFKIFPNVLSGLDTTSNRSFSLVIQAVSANGHKAHTSLPSSLNQLVLFKGSARYDGRDEEEGGDDWLLPQVREYVNDIPGATWGDFSNMNGGAFVGHDRHRDGRSADGWVEGYNALDENTADSLIALLNSGPGSRIRFMYVAYNRNPGNKFYNAIRGRKLGNGRKVENVILPDSQHRTHFHAEF